MDNFKVIPTKNGVTAPAIFIEAKNHTEAEKLGRKMSGLGRFKEWYFTAIKYTPKESKGSKKRSYEN